MNRESELIVLNRIFFKLALDVLNSKNNNVNAGVNNKLSANTSKYRKIYSFIKSKNFFYIRNG